MSRLYGIRSLFGLASILSLVASSGCAMDAAYDDDNYDTVEEEILNGDTPAGADKNANVSVMLREGTSYCSGVLIQNKWVLTSAHCLLTTLPNAGNDPGLLQVIYKGDSLGAKWIQKHPWYDSADKSHDIALVQLSTGAYGMPTSLEGWTVHLTSWLPASTFDDSVLRCYGYGDNVSNAGAGTLRMADLEVVSTTTDTLDFAKSAKGQNLAHGDSGGGCFMKYPPFGEPADLPYLVGLNRITWASGSRADYVPGYEEWIAETIEQKKWLDARPAFSLNPCYLNPWRCLKRTVTTTAGDDGNTPTLLPSAAPAENGTESWSDDVQ